MSTIELQLALENTILQRTSERFHKVTTEAEQSGRASSTDAARRLHALFISDLAEAMVEFIAIRKGKPGKGGKYTALLTRVSPEFSVQVGLQELFDNVFTDKRSLQDAFIKIGIRIEDDIKFSKFKEEHPNYFDTVIRDFKTRGTTNYRHMHRVLTSKMREFDVSWENWTALERVKTGEHIASVIIAATPLFQIKKPVQVGKNSPPTMLVVTDYALEWIKKYKEYAQYLRPLGAPAIIPPKDWESLYHGGFYSPELQSKFPFVRTRHQKEIQGGNFTEHMQAVNKLQATAWQINPRVCHFLEWAMQSNFTSKIKLPAAQPYIFPASPVAGKDKENFTDSEQEEFLNWKRETARLHTMERKRYSESLSLWRLMAMTEEYKPFDKFYFIYTCDFRGRIYPVTAGLSPQGADYSKALLQFSEGKGLGASGAFWLGVRGANLFGYDKDSYQGRYEFIRTYDADIQAVGSNPCSSESVSFIANADKPLQFLAFCFDWAGYLEEGDSYISKLPIGLDGSCNGLQNFSAILRDTVGGLATNVLPNDLPNDIYGDVAAVALTGLKTYTGDYTAPARKLLSFDINRGATKRSVMTLPYGLTKHSSSQYVGDWIYAEYQNSFSGYTELNVCKNLLNEFIWDAIGQVVRAAREGMDWLQAVAKIVGKEEQPLVWTTPTGFLVYQKDNKSKTIRVHATLDDLKRYSIREWTDEVDKVSLRNGSAPNYIHSMDASHLVKTVLECIDITSFQMIHDDFGCHAADIPELHRAIRVSFYKMYRDKDMLDIFRREVQSYTAAELPAPPTVGNMDIKQVLKSEYFFG